MGTRIIEGAFVNVDFGGIEVLARVCVNGDPAFDVNAEPAFDIKDLATYFDSEIPADIREKHVFKYLDESDELAEEECLATLEGALLWASRVQNGEKWADFIREKVVPSAKSVYDDLFECFRRELRNVHAASREVARLKSELYKWEVVEEKTSRHLFDLDAQLYGVEPA